MRIDLKKYFFLFGLFFLPFIFNPGGEIPYEIPKVWFFYRWTEVLLFLGIFDIPKWIKEKAMTQKKKPFLFFSAGIYVFTAFLVSAFGVDFSKSLWGNYYRLDGLITLLHFFALFLFLHFFWQKKWQDLTIKTIALSSIILSFWSIILKIIFWLFAQRLPPSNWGASFFGQDIGGTFGNPNFLSGYLLVSLPFVFFLLGKTKRVWKIFLSAVVGLAIFFTGSFIGVLGFCLLAFGYGFSRISLKIKVLIIILAGILGISLFFWKNDPENIFESRQRIFTRGLVGFEKKPFMGYGWANFDRAFGSNYWPIKYNHDIYVDKAHSLFLENLIAGGVILFSVYLWLIFLILRSFFRIKDEKDWQKLLLFTFVIYLFHSQTNIISINEEIFFWMIAGIVSSEG